MLQPTFTGQRFLVVEDEPLITIELRRILEGEGAMVFAAHSISKALQQADVPALSAGIIDLRLGQQEADAVCEALERRQVPFVFYTGVPSAPYDRWPAAPVIGKPAKAAAIIGAVKYVVSAERRDILSPDPRIITADQRIAEGEERIERVRSLIARLQSAGFDTSVAHNLLVTMIQSLDLMRDHSRLLASERWTPPTRFRVED